MKMETPVLDACKKFEWRNRKRCLHDDYDDSADKELRCNTEIEIWEQAFFAIIHIYNKKYIFIELTNCIVLNVC